jgi:hypothetical protein
MLQERNKRILCIKRESPNRQRAQLPSQKGIQQSKRCHCKDGPPFSLKPNHCSHRKTKQNTHRNRLVIQVAAPNISVYHSHALTLSAFLRNIFRRIFRRQRRSGSGFVVFRFGGGGSGFRDIRAIRAALLRDSLKLSGWIQPHNHAAQIVRRKRTECMLH